MNSKKLQILYCQLFGFFYVLYCIGIGYVNIYLTGRGLQPGSIGLITALFGAAAALVQPVLGRIADKSRIFHWKTLLLLLFGLCLAFYMMQVFFHAGYISGLTCGMILLLLNAITPFINGAVFYYQKNGYKVDFGSARGCGSLMYSLSSLLLGQCVARLGVQIITTAGIIFSVVLLLIVWRMPYMGEKTCEDAIAKESVRKGFARKYPRFLCMFAGAVFLLMFHNMTSTYMLQMMEQVGGGSAETGILFAIAGILEIPVMFSIVPLIRKFGSGNLLVVAGVAFFIKSVIYTVASSVAVLYAAQILQMFSYALLASVSVFFSDEIMDAEDKLKGQALVGSAITCGGVLGNLAGGVILQYLGLDAMLWIALMMAGVGMITILMMRFLKWKKS